MDTSDLIKVISDRLDELAREDFKKRFMMGGSNDPASVIQSFPPDADSLDSGYAMRQMMGAQQNAQDFSHKVTLPDSGPTRDLPPVELTKDQYEAAKLAGMLEQGTIANHFMRDDDPGGLSGAAKALMHTYHRAGDPVVFTIQRKVIRHVGPKPQPLTWEQSVEALNIVQTVKAALGLKEPVTEQELAEAQRAVLLGQDTLSGSASALQNAIISARNGPIQQARQVHTAIRRYLDAKVTTAVQEATPHVPKNAVDASVLDQVNAIANRIGENTAGASMDWRDRMLPDGVAAIRQKAWDEWASARAYELEKATTDKGKDPEGGGVAKIRRINGEEFSLLKRDFPGIELSAEDVLQSTYVVTTPDDIPDMPTTKSLKVTVEETEEDTFDIYKALDAAFEGAPP